MISLRPHNKPQVRPQIVILSAEGIMYGKLPSHIPRIGYHFLIKLLPFQEKHSPLVQCKGTID